MSMDISKCVRPLLFLDFDDVLVLNLDGNPGGYDAIAPNPPPDIWQKLFHAPAVAVLRTVFEEFAPAYVITTSWLQFLHPEGLVQILRRCGLDFVADNLHEQPEAPFTRGRTRADAIAAWLQANHRGEPYVILDDTLSGTGLDQPIWQKGERVVLCDVRIGLLPDHLPAIRRALTSKPRKDTR